MKQLLALLLALMMLFSVATVFAGCEDSGKKKKSSSSQDDDDDDEDDEDEEDDDKNDDDVTDPDATDPDTTDPDVTDPEPTETEPPVIGTDYTIYVVDEYGNPVSGVKVQICDDNNLCKAPKTTDENGMAVYEDQEDGNYKAQLTKLPEGYEVDDMDAYYRFDGDTEVTIVVDIVEPEPTVTEPTGVVLDPDNYFYNEENTYYDEDAIAIRPTYVYWGEDGWLYAECAVINGFSYAVSDIYLDRYTLGNADGVIAEGNFGLLEGTLEPYTYEIWTLQFDPSAVYAFGADLSYLTYEWEVS